MRQQFKLAWCTATAFAISVSLALIFYGIFEAVIWAVHQMVD